MIREQFLYFAQYPAKDGVCAILTNGTSDTPGYNELLQKLQQLPQKSRLPEIDNYVYGQSFDELQERISRLQGSYLFVDYGELNMNGDSRNSFVYNQRIAITIARKMPNRSDAADYMLSSDHTLRLLALLHAHIMADAEEGKVPWFSRDYLDKAEIIPFVASELSSVGWTLMLECPAPDTLNTHQLYRSFLKHNE
ncbi:MAG: hypothetical protein PUK67_03680 [Prevotellaceae bacterium]|nr:hypothetical protein [Prevotellaceae bacterium]MDY3365137.1 hypothetical protein [Prevotella sp.]